MKSRYVLKNTYVFDTEYNCYLDDTDLIVRLDENEAKLQTIQEKLQVRQSDCMGRIDWCKGVDGMLVGELLAILKEVDSE